MIFKVYVFVMFKMKHLINRMQCSRLSQKCGGLMVRVFVSILKVNGSNLINGVFVVNNGKLTKYSLM